ncbi:Transcriptional regulator, LacI family [Deinococcus marmoris]|uniref:Transcriptional regulator, LacI family n=1 Tax=Deinococcus marmoris TaxID=249408 RepID=A0A1U7NR36_9DEIO|nr:Transcriptional regulator, LacI family [Deinococcus marmoris]
MATVSLVMRGLKGPSQATRRRIFDVAQRLGYFPAILTPKMTVILRADRQGQALMDALRDDPFYAQVFAGIEARAATLRLRLGTERHREDVEPYGMIYVGHNAGKLLVEAESGGGLHPAAPTVVVNQTHPQLDHVITQNRHGAALAVAHLLERVSADSHVAIVTGPINFESYEVRLHGAQAALQAAGRLHPELVFALESLGGCRREYAQRVGREAARWLLAQPHTIGGVFVYNDIAASALMNELLDRGMRLPNQLKVVGFEDTPEAAAAPVPLTTVRVDHHSMGAWAVDLLLLRMMEPARPTAGVTVGIELVERRSTALD